MLDAGGRHQMPIGKWLYAGFVCGTGSQRVALTVLGRGLLHDAEQSGLLHGCQHFHRRRKGVLKARDMGLIDQDLSGRHGSGFFFSHGVYCP